MTRRRSEPKRLHGELVVVDRSLVYCISRKESRTHQSFKSRVAICILAVSILGGAISSPESIAMDPVVDHMLHWTPLLITCTTSWKYKLNHFLQPSSSNTIPAGLPSWTSHLNIASAQSEDRVQTFLNKLIAAGDAPLISAPQYAPFFCSEEKISKCSSVVRDSSHPQKQTKEQSGMPILLHTLSSFC
jgi:hypothetical protein